jgi:catechol 2,3-dioxygenase-like lactoylglutathione lyase family enzyme
MAAFQATSTAQVRAWHAAGLAHGGTDEGAPGLRDNYGSAFYVAYLRDPDGHKIRREWFWHPTLFHPNPLK